MQSDPCRAGAHARCAQPDPDCDCACHKGEGIKEAWQEAVTANLNFYPGPMALYMPNTPPAFWLEACYEERERHAKENWVINAEWSGDLRGAIFQKYGATYPAVPPDTRYYVPLAPPVVDDKTGLQQGERVIRTWHSPDGQHIETNIGNHYVLRGSAMDPNARWERE